MSARSDSRNAMGTDGSRRATIDAPSDREIVITWVFDAPRSLVFEMWTRPEHVAQWWDPSRLPLAICEIDLRPNGRFRFVNQGALGQAHPFTGTYREIVPPERLVFATRSTPSGAETVGTLLFSEHDGSTTLTLTMTCASKADRDALLAMRVDVGTARTLENLAEYLAASAGRE